MEILFNKILETIRKNNACLAVTIVDSQGSSPRHIGSKMLIFGDGSIQGSIGGGALEKLVMSEAGRALRRRRSFLKTYHLDKKSGLQVCGGRVSVFFEAIEPRRKLLIAGAGHIGLALSYIAKLLNFYLIIVDNRRNFADKKRFPHADEIFCRPWRRALDNIAVDKNVSVVIVTHGHRYDLQVLKAVVNRDAAYVGMIASRQKVRHVFGILEKDGFKRERLKKIHAPIGLDIGAETPEEIAVSIAAELIKTQRLEEGRVKKEAGYSSY